MHWWSVFPHSVLSLVSSQFSCLSFPTILDQSVKVFFFQLYSFSIEFYSDYHILICLLMTCHKKSDCLPFIVVLSFCCSTTSHLLLWSSKACVALYSKPYFCCFNFLLHHFVCFWPIPTSSSITLIKRTDWKVKRIYRLFLNSLLWRLPWWDFSNSGPGNQLENHQIQSSQGHCVHLWQFLWSFGCRCHTKRECHLPAATRTGSWQNSSGLACDSNLGPAILTPIVGYKKKI